MSDSLQPHDCSSPASSIHGILSRQEYWNGLPFPPPGDLPNPGLLCLLYWQADSLPLSHLRIYIYIHFSHWYIYIYISVYKNIYHTYQGQIKLWTFKHQLLSMGRWGNGWLGLHKLITKENREAFNPILNKAELNIHYKKE